MIYEKNEILQMLSHSFYTKAEFNKLLFDYATQNDLIGIYFEVEKKYNEDSECYEYTYGKEISSPDMIKSSYEEGSTVVIKTHIKSSKKISSEVEEEISLIIKSYLEIENISRSTKLPCCENQKGNECILPKLEATVKRFLDLGKSVAIFMIDLDHFKDVNDQNDHEVGSNVLFEFSNILTKCCEEKAIVIHRSGDEFFVIEPYTDLIEPLELAYQIKEQSMSHKYQHLSQPINLTAAQGICLIKDYDISFNDAVNFAEKAYKPHNQDKHRNSVRINCPYKTSYECNHNVNLDLDLAYVVVCSHLAERCVFHNPYLDFISYMLSQLKRICLMKDEVNRWLTWLRPNNAIGMKILNLSNDLSFDCEWSNEELAFALFHGMCRNPFCQGKAVNLTFYQDKSTSFSVAVDSEIFFSYGEEFDIKKQEYNIKLPEYPMKDCLVRNTILIYIGYDSLIIPDCFYRVIRIDSRPIIGGNLPDFWAGTLAELIDIILDEPSINQVIVYGKSDNAKKLCDILKNITQWGSKEYSLSFLSNQTKHSSISIEECRSRLADHISFVDENQKNILIQHLKKIYNENTIKKKSLSKCMLDSHRPLVRNLLYETIKLKIEDGCIVNTMEEAFPTVLEIIRNCGSDEIMVDQAGRKLKELNNFKLTILKPSSKTIPEYCLGQEEDLEKYFQSILGNKEGFFQKHLEENNQYQAVIEHIVSLIENMKLKYATRRALLVIPHKIINHQDISPLGLISIYISPRQIEDEIIFDFSFTWRTVEAVVGFPYSLYGSVRYAESILNEIKERVKYMKTPKLKMGHLFYMAYSLHMFLDSSYTRIVRGIINDATK